MLVLSCYSLLRRVAEEWGKGVSFGNVQVKNNANRFLLQKAICIPFHELGVACVAGVRKGRGRELGRETTRAPNWNWYPVSSPERFQLLNPAVFCWFLSFCSDSAATNNVCLCFCQKVPRFSLAIMLWSLSSQGRRGIRISSIDYRFE